MPLSPQISFVEPKDITAILRQQAASPAPSQASGCSCLATALTEPHGELLGVLHAVGRRQHPGGMNEHPSAGQLLLGVQKDGLKVTSQAASDNS